MIKKKEIIKRLDKTCAVCGREIKVILYHDKSYRRGYYFDEIPIYTKKELKNALKAGTHKERIGNWEIEVLNKDPKPYKCKEYWECPKCYWRK